MPLALNKMQTASVKIGIRMAESTSYDDNRYGMALSKIEDFIKPAVHRSKRGAQNVSVTVDGNSLGDPSSNPERGISHFA